jgi:bile acid:Na+ symporter, BASS family
MGLSIFAGKSMTILYKIQHHCMKYFICLPRFFCIFTASLKSPLMKQNRNALIHCMLTAMILIAALMGTPEAKAENLNQKIRKLKPGMDAAEVMAIAGTPKDVIPVERWFYPLENQVVVANEKIIDIRLNPELRDRSISFRNQKQQGQVDPVRLLRIGMSAKEAIETAGEPLHIVEGEDWNYSARQRVEMTEGYFRAADLHLKASLEALDWVRLNFSAGGLLFMNITLAFIMFGVALGIKLEHFKMLASRPKPVLLGIFSQFIALPALTFLLVLIIRPTASVAMGMILVAACPGGNISNFISSLAKGNVALSITLTAFATISAIFMTPFNFALWGKLYAEASSLVIPISIDPVEMLKTVVILLGIPVVLGIAFANRFPQLTQKIMKPFRTISLLLFLGFIIAAFSSNFSYFLKYIHLIILIVLAHNALALLTGFSIATLGRVPRPDRRSLSIETGIQNSGIALVLIFNPRLFDGLGGMAFIAAWWGIWHIMAGLTMAYFWSKKPLPETEPAATQ